MARTSWPTEPPRTDAGASLSDIDDAIAALKAGAPADLNDFNEVAAAISDDAAFAATVTTALAGKAATSHSHPISDVTSLQASLDSKAATSHVHSAADVTSGTLVIARGGTGQSTAEPAFDALAPTTTRGDIITRGASTNGRLAVGTSGYHLSSDGTDPSWMGFLQSGTGAVTRTWQAKARDSVSLSDFGVEMDNTTDCGTELLAAIAHAKSLGADLWFPAGIAYSSVDLPDLHDVICRGPGAVRIATGIKWYSEASTWNTSDTSSAKNTIYVSPTGDDVNSGLAAEFPLLTIQRAFDILALQQQPLSGYFAIVLAEGGYAAGATTINFQSARNRRVLISGPSVSTWDNTDPPDDPVSISSITSANPPVVTTSTSHGRSNGDKIFIGLAQRSGGMHSSDGKVYTVANQTGTTFDLSGIDGSGWAAYTSGGKMYDCTGSAPLAVVYGAGAVTNGIVADGGAHLRIDDVALIGCGSKATTASIGALLSTNRSWIETNNVHQSDCTAANFVRDYSSGFFGGGKIYNCGKANWAIHARFTFSSSSAATPTLTTTPIYKNCAIGVDIWEGATGHADGAIFLDCDVSIFLRRSNSYCVAGANRYTNTGSSKIGIVVNDGGTLNRDPTNDIWTGTYAPRVLIKNGSREYDENFGVSANSVFNWRIARISNGSTSTPAGGEATQLSHTLYQTQMAARPQQIRISALVTGTWANGNVVFRLKLDGTTLYTLTLASNAGAREVYFVIEGYQNGFATIRSVLTGFDKQASTVTRIDDYFSAGFNTASSDTTLTLTSEVVHASDSISVHKVVLEGMGW